MTQSVDKIPPQDLSPDKIGNYQWEESQRKESLNKLFEQVTNSARETIKWYLREKEGRKRRAVLIRRFAIILGGIGAVLPTLSQIFSDSYLYYNPGWATVSFTFAGALVLFDNFFGYSNAWMRFIEAILSLQKVLKEFELQWEIDRASWKSGEPTQEQIVEMIKKVKNFVMRIDDIVRKETNEWILEFRKNLKQLDNDISKAANSNIDKTK